MKITRINSGGQEFHHSYQYWNWIERMLVRKSGRHFYFYLVVCIYLLLLLYNAWNQSISYSFDLQEQLKLFIGFALIPYLMIGISYFTKQIQTFFLNIKSCFNDDNVYNQLNERLEKSFMSPIPHYILIIIFITTFLIFPDSSGYNLDDILSPEFTFDYGLLFLNFIISNFIFYLMAIVLWIALNILWATEDLAINETAIFFDIDIFLIDTLDDLHTTIKLILRFAVFFFIALSAAIFNFISDCPAQLVFIIMIFLFNVCAFLREWYILDNIFETKRMQEINRLNMIYLKPKQLLIDRMNDKNFEDDNDLTLLANKLNIIYTEIDRVKNARKFGHNTRDLITFIISSLLPIISAILTYYKP